MAPANDNSDRNSTLPVPELNPLLNPVLGAHLGRWAEVYFTSPPEKREAAVLELLRELERGTAAPRHTTGAPERTVQEPGKPPSEPAALENAEQDWIVCESCGGRNILGNKFCGMCGAWLEHASAAPTGPASGTSRGVGERDRYDRDRYNDDFNTYSGKVAATQEVPRNSWPPRPDLPSLIPEDEPVPYRYRMYVGAAVAILISALVYIAWHGAAAWSGNSHRLPQSAPTTEMQPPAQAQTPPPSAQVKPGQVLPSSAPAPVERNPGAARSRPRRTEANRETNTVAPSTPSAPRSHQIAAPIAAAPIVAPLQGNGAEELTVAESYLNGTRGRARDSSEAAKWLWRSIGKENATATLLLSDLYLRGDGVPQSCDQARLLLDAAARKGAPGAAKKIRDLPSLGCP